MHKIITFICLGIAFIFSAPVLADQHKENRNDCRKEAKEDRLEGREHSDFMRECMKEHRSKHDEDSYADKEHKHMGKDHKHMGKKHKNQDHDHSESDDDDDHDKKHKDKKDKKQKHDDDDD